MFARAWSLGTVNRKYLLKTNLLTIKSSNYAAWIREENVNSSGGLIGISENVKRSRLGYVAGKENRGSSFLFYTHIREYSKDPCKKDDGPCKPKQVQDLSNYCEESVKNPCSKGPPTPPCCNQEDSCPPKYNDDIFDHIYSCPPPSQKNVRRAKIAKILFFFVGVPSILVQTIRCYFIRKEEKKKPRKPYIDYPYLGIRTKPFPWGDGNHTFFHNAVLNPVPPDGYEVDDPNDPNSPNGPLRPPPDPSRKK